MAEKNPSASYFIPLNFIGIDYRSIIMFLNPKEPRKLYISILGGKAFLSHICDFISLAKIFMIRMMK